ncbi:hypothetical protein [Tenggerimyces flavus]|uniref:Uncharacterized protein n=1 Tax=Tenggerimyces flavus TaxID=1708749 RepID=A0ABV7Y2J8_9ACTN|nr:hypothetical protein [Tenggerimyces flavus]MBM7790827.1 hypothetical protein [Tenggerimyces flavus]
MPKRRTVGTPLPRVTTAPSSRTTHRALGRADPDADVDRVPEAAQAAEDPRSDEWYPTVQSYGGGGESYTDFPVDK